MDKHFNWKAYINEKRKKNIDLVMSYKDLFLFLFNFSVASIKVSCYMYMMAIFLVSFYNMISLFGVPEKCSIDQLHSCKPQFKSHKILPLTCPVYVFLKIVNTRSI